MSVSELQLHGSFLSCKHAFYQAEVRLLFIALFWVASAWSHRFVFIFSLSCCLRFLLHVPATCSWTVLWLFPPNFLSFSLSSLCPFFKMQSAYWPFPWNSVSFFVSFFWLFIVTSNSLKQIYIYNTVNCKMIPFSAELYCVLTAPVLDAWDPDAASCVL